MIDRQRTRIFGLGLGLALSTTLLMVVDRQGGQISPDSARQLSLHAPDVTFAAPGTHRSPRPGTEMTLDEPVVEEILQRVLQNVERVLLEQEHRAVLGIVAGGPLPTGVRIIGVTPDGPAHQAGLRSGDVILALDGQPLAHNGATTPVDQLLALLQVAAPGEAVSLRYARGDAIAYADATLGDLADLPGSSHVQQPWDGLELAPLSAELGRYFGTAEGWLVTRAPAQLSQLQDGDVLQRIGTRVPRSEQHARDILNTYHADEALRVTVVRNHHALELSLTESPPAAPLPPETFPVPPSATAEDSLDAACVMRRL